MAAAKRLGGVLTPVVTPFDDDLAPDSERLIAQCRWLLSQDVGLAVFGTNSEANSLSTDEKIDLLDCLVDAGIDPARMMPGTGCCALTDTLKLTNHAVNLGCAGVLMLPPFYYKDVSDDGLFRSFAEIIERVANDALQVYLYHIPPISNVGLSIDLIERLLGAYPKSIAGIKDSSGNWDNTSAMLQRNWADFQIFAGSENFLLQVMRAGGAGCISATANINPAAIHKLYCDWQTNDANQQQAALDELRAIVQAFPMIPALKSIVAKYSDDPDWRRVRPPLLELSDEQNDLLLNRLNSRGFSMPGLGAS
jgi:4-hydroxy-tetrahydrodipicolinate synthase